MRYFTLFFALFTLSFSQVKSQIVIGQLTESSGSVISLYGFNGLKNYLIGQDTIDQKGNFSIQYAQSDWGMGFLIAADSKPFNIILSADSTTFDGRSLSELQSINIKAGNENKWFEQYALENPIREQALSAWAYLSRLYQSDKLFSNQQDTRSQIKKEYGRIILEDSAFLTSLPKESYAHWYLPLRKNISIVPMVAQNRPLEISRLVQFFRNLDYAGANLFKSGLLKDAIDAQFWLLANSGLSVENIEREMRISVDSMLKYLVRDEVRLNQVSQYLFQLLESQGFVNISEYLALKILSLVGCTIESDFNRQLESYRAMKRGQVAPDFTFGTTKLTPGYVHPPSNLSDLKSRYTLVVFGASWCPQCVKEIPEISNLYPILKQKDIEVVFVSLDTVENDFKNFAKDFPFISTCDFKKWDGGIVSSYYVFATPTMYFLGNDRRILLRPNNLEQLDVWIRSGLAE